MRSGYPSVKRGSVRHCRRLLTTSYRVFQKDGSLYNCIPEYHSHRQSTMRYVCCHGKFGHLILNDEIIEVLLLRPFVPESHSIIVNTKTNIHSPFCSRLYQFQNHFVVLIPDTVIFSPYRRPCFVKRRSFRPNYFKSICQIRGFHKFHSKRRRVDYSFVFVADAVHRNSIFYLCIEQHCLIGSFTVYAPIVAGINTIPATMVFLNPLLVILIIICRRTAQWSGYRLMRLRPWP